MVSCGGFSWDSLIWIFFGFDGVEKKKNVLNSVKIWIKIGMYERKYL